MDPMLHAQRRCLQALHDACAVRPALHAHQLLALSREQAFAADASDLDGYRRRSGDGFELVRAGHLDRLAGSMAVATALGEPHAVAAARIDYSAALDATSINDFATHVHAGAVRSATAHRRSDTAAGSFARCVLNLLMQHASEPQMADHAAAARAAWQDLAEADPVAALAAQEQPDSLSRLALRLPWRGEALVPVTRWLARMPTPGVPGSDEHEEPGSKASDSQWLEQAQRAWRARWHSATPAGDHVLLPLPDVQAVLAPYRRVVEAQSTPRPVLDVAHRALGCAAGASNAIELQCRLTASNMPAALAAAWKLPELSSIEARQALWPEPLLARHVRSLRSALAEAHTLTEVELASAHADACLAVEADWNRLLMTSLLAPLQAAAMVAVFGAEAEAGLRRAAGVSYALLGLGPRALLRSPALAGFLAQRLLPGVDETGDQGSWNGEAGRELLAPLRGWVAMRRAEGASAADSRTLSQACIDLLDRCRVDEPTAVERPLSLWRHSGSVPHWDRLIATSSRPPLPGWTTTADLPPPL